MSQEFLDEVLSSISPMAKAAVNMVAPNIVANPTFAAVAEMVKSLAEADGLSVSTFIQSGRAISVLQGLATQGKVPEKGDVSMSKCPKCHHVHYEFNQ